MLRARIPLPRFVSAGEIISGRGAIGALRALDATSVAVVCGKAAPADSERRRSIVAALGPAEHAFFEGPSGEPTLQHAQGLAGQLDALRPDWIVAVGGGAVLDSAKLAWAMYEHPSTTLDLRAFSLPSLRGRARFCAVPTVAGAGSEVSSAAMFIDGVSGEKRSLVSHELLPDVVLIDPAFSLGAPGLVVAHGAMDALAHALEGFGSRHESAFADVQAEAAARVIFRALPVRLENPTDVESQLELHSAAVMAGWVQNQKVPGIGHALAHQLTGHSHGAATGALLPHAIRFNCQLEPIRRKYDALGARLGFSDSEGLAAACETLAQRAGLTRFVPPLLTPALVEAALRDPCARANPRELSSDDVHQFWEQLS